MREALSGGCKPAWLRALVVDRCHASSLSERLAMQKVEGSSPFIRLKETPANAGVSHMRG